MQDGSEAGATINDAIIQIVYGIYRSRRFKKIVSKVLEHTPCVVQPNGAYMLTNSHSETGGLHVLGWGKVTGGGQWYTGKVIPGSAWRLAGYFHEVYPFGSFQNKSRGILERPGFSQVCS